MPTIPSSLEQTLCSSAPADALKAVINYFGCQAGTLHLLHDGALELTAHHGIPSAVAQIVQSVPIGKGIAGLAAQRREPITICNLQSDTSGQARPGAKATGMEGSIAVPMLVNGDLVGVLGIAKAATHEWSADETALLIQIGGRLGAQLVGKGEHAAERLAD